jgi:cobalt-zinc-cadmium efflux system outer membrane protein
MCFHLQFGALLALACVGVAGAQDQRLELDALVGEALRSNPQVLAAQKRYEAARQRPSQASSLPDPTLSLGYSSNGNPLPLTGVGTQPTSNIGFSFTQEFPYPGKLRLRGEISAKEAGAELAQYTLVQRNVVARLSQAYYRLQHTYPAAEVLDRNHALLETLLRIIETRYAAGLGSQQEVFKTQTELSILETKKVQLDRERRTREAEINSLLNRPAGTPVGQPVEPHVHEIAMTLDEIKARGAETAPELRRDQKLVERSEVSLNLARKEAYPDYSLTGGYFYMGGMPPMYQVRADIKLPLYIGRKQHAGVAEQWQRVAEARHEYAAAGQSLGFRIEDAYLTAQTSYKLLNLYLNTVIPQAHLALQSSLTSYQTGTADFLSVFTNHIMVVEYEMNYHEEMLNFHLAVSQLEELTGLDLTKEAQK